MPEIILTVVRRCRYCQREMFRPPLEYEQNPFCTKCLTERVQKAAPAGGVRWKKEGNYVIAEGVRKRPSNGRERCSS